MKRFTLRLKHGGCEERLLVCFTAHPPGAAGYSRQEQIDPFTFGVLERDAEWTVKASLE